jgi:hypothetical protein
MRSLVKIMLIMLCMLTPHVSNAAQTTIYATIRFETTLSISQKDLTSSAGFTRLPSNVQIIKIDDCITVIVP